MISRTLYIVFLISQYSFTAGDLFHLISYMASKENLFVMISIFFTLVGVEILVYSPNVLISISPKYRCRVQLIIHSLLGFNSLVWMYLDHKNISNFILFGITFAFNMIVVHKILHAVHEEKLIN